MEATLQSLIESTRKEIDRRHMVPTSADQVAQDIRLRGTVRISIEMAKAFPGWETFKSRATDASVAGMTEGAALALWRPTVQILRMGTHFAEGTAVLDEHKSQLEKYEQEARSELRARIAPAMEARFPRGKKYAFWSGGEKIARAFASQQGYEALETTTLGGLFNGLAFFEGTLFPSAWDAVKPLWLELSRAYATQVRGEVHIFARWSGDIFAKVERPAVPADVTFKWHALVPKLEVAPGARGPDCKGPQDVTDVSGAAGTTEENWKSQIEAGLKAWRDHHGVTA
jgi:hypothetical protein